MKAHKSIPQDPPGPIAVCLTLPPALVDQDPCPYEDASLDWHFWHQCTWHVEPQWDVTLIQYVHAAAAAAAASVVVVVVVVAGVVVVVVAVVYRYTMYCT